MMFNRISKRYKNILLIGLFITFLFCLSFTIGYAVKYDGYIVNVEEGIFVNGNTEYTITDIPFSYCGVSYVPVEDCLKNDGFGFGWNSERSTLVVSNGETVYEMKNESRLVYKNNAEQSISMPVKLWNDKFYAPAEFFEKVMNKKILFRGEMLEQFSDKLDFVSGADYFLLNNTRFEMPGKAIRYNGYVYFPAETVLNALCFDLGWDVEKNAMVVHRNNLFSYVENSADKLRRSAADRSVYVPAFMYYNLFYMSENELSVIADIQTEVQGELEETLFNTRDLLADTVIPDAYRINAPVKQYRGCCTVGNMAMEILNISQSDAVLYAGVVNALADALPAVTTYSIVVPNSSEFYAPVNKCAHQIDGIKTVYQNLSPNVIPINAVKPLSQHLGEKLYFDTDHHWTQRGAYYVYRALNDLRGYRTPDLSEFATDHVFGYVGSFAGFMKGTEGERVCRKNPDLLERFLPSVEVSGEAFSDMNMTKSLGAVYAVDKRYNTYMTFVSGDSPISRFVTGNKNGRSVMIIKESYGNALATWAMNDYETVYVLDPRKFNGFGGAAERFNLTAFYNRFPFDDLIIINYPVGMTSGLRQAIYNLIQ